MTRFVSEEILRPEVLLGLVLLVLIAYVVVLELGASGFLSEFEQPWQRYVVAGTAILCVFGLLLLFA